MKKILGIVLIMTLILSISLPVYAGEVPAEDFDIVIGDQHITAAVLVLAQEWLKMK